MLSRDRFHTFGDLADILEDARHYPHDPAGHVDDADDEARGQRQRADTDEPLGPQPQAKPGGAHHQQAVQREHRRVHEGNHAQLRLEGGHPEAQPFFDVTVLAVGVGKQLDGEDVGVAVHHPAGQPRTGVGIGDGALLHPRHEIAQCKDVADDPGQQRHGQPPVGLREQVDRRHGVDQHEPDRFDALDDGFPQRRPRLHDFVGDAAGEVILEIAERLAQHPAVRLPAHPVGERRRDGLVLDQIADGEGERPEDGGNHRHPGQQHPVIVEKAERIGRQPHPVDQPADKGEQRDFDDGGGEPHHHQQHEYRPHRLDVVPVEGEQPLGRPRLAALGEGVDMLFEPAQHKTCLLSMHAHAREMKLVAMPGQRSSGSQWAKARFTQRRACR